MILLLVLAAQQPFPESCLMTGLCQVTASPSPVASGTLFVAVGLVALGTWGYRRRGRAK